MTDYRSEGRTIMADIDMPLAMRMQADGYLMRINKLEDDNAKLRKLCADIYEMAYYECPSAFEAAFAGSLRELGVIVNV